MKFFRILWLWLFFFLLPLSLGAGEVEIGDPATFSVRLDDQSGNLSALVHRGEKLTLGDGRGQMFDFQQEGEWMYWKEVPKFISMEKTTGHRGLPAIETKWVTGHWTLFFLYEVDSENATLGRSLRIVWDGEAPVKLHAFWMALPAFPFENDARFFVPINYPPQKFTPDTFPEGDRRYSYGNSAPLVFQWNNHRSVIVVSDNLYEFADRPTNGLERRDGGIRLTQSYDIKGIFKPGVEQKAGISYLRIVDGDDETALLKFHELLQQIGHVVPENRTEWFKSAILYSFHPGGTIGSDFKDLGGFKASLPLLERIRNLGCNSIWIMPLEDMGPYWPRNYYQFMDGLGTTPEKAGEEYKELVHRAHELGLYVLQDCVPHGGSNQNQRAIEHPEWLVQQEDGQTFNYWCFDFNWPSWQAYMADVATYYVREYGVDGYRVDAVAGSWRPNWNPDIPYMRATHSESQGGLNMLRALRGAVKKLKPEEGAILAEAQGSVFAAESDATYDFSFHETVIGGFLTAPPATAVDRMRRWLHEQQFTEIRDMLRLRYVESHDSVRGQPLYGLEPNRALVALCCFIHGLPMIYHEQEYGNETVFQRLFAVRRILAEMQGGDADYLSIDAPPGVFAALRTKQDNVSLVLINFNDTTIDASVSVPVDKLPSGFHHTRLVEWIDAFSPEHFGRLEQANHLFIGHYTAAPFQVSVWSIRKDKGQLESLQNSLLSISSPPVISMTDIADVPVPEVADAYRLRSGKNEAFIDPRTGLLIRFDVDGIPTFGSAEMRHGLTATAPPTVIKGDNSITATHHFDQATLQIEYFVSPTGGVDLKAQWNSEKIPDSSEMSLVVLDPRFWSVHAAEGVVDAHYHPRPLGLNSRSHGIYWRPQGTDTVFDSFMIPLGIQQGGAIFRNPKTGDQERSAAILFPANTPLRFRLRERSDEGRGLIAVVSLTDSEVPVLGSEPAFHLSLGTQVSAPVFPLRQTAGGWIYENEHYRIQLRRSGTISGVWRKDASGHEQAVFGSGDLYTDTGYVRGNARYGARHEVEQGIRFVQDGDRLRCYFEGRLRGPHRFDLMGRSFIEYAFEYVFESGPGFQVSCKVKPRGTPPEGYTFLGMILPMPETKSALFSKGDHQVTPLKIEGDDRIGETGKKIPDRILFKTADELTIAEMNNLRGELANVFFAHACLFLTFDDGLANVTPETTRDLSFSIHVK